MAAITAQSSQYIKALARELEIPEEHYRRAERSYQSFGQWTHREDSNIRDYSPEVYVQGSFRLGTAIKPSNSEDEYDIDLVCVLEKLTKNDMTQHELKNLLGVEVESYRTSKGIKKPVVSGRRCWTLEYADGVQFHMDILPALPNETGQRLLLESRGLDASYVGSAISITDEQDAKFSSISDEWPRSNPKGYAEWFKGRMSEIFETMRKELSESETRMGVQASVEDIPEYRVRTPLQQAIMILKRHRDDMFAEDEEGSKPISIIISTLSAHSYNGEADVADALMTILERMDQFVLYDGEKYAIPNPTDASENFADKWGEHPERKEAFFSWLERARSDFSALSNLANLERMTEHKTTILASDLTERALQTARKAAGISMLSAATTAPAAATDYSFSNAPRKPNTPRDFA